MQPQQLKLTPDHEFRVVVIDQLAQFIGLREVETFFERLQVHLELADLLEQLSLFSLSLVFGLGLLAPAEQLAGPVEQLSLSLSHLDQVNGVIGSDLLNCLAATDRLHGDSRLELGAVGVAFVHWWEPLSGAVPRLRG